MGTMSQKKLSELTKISIENKMLEKLEYKKLKLIFKYTKNAK
jgi:hypothetical protein